ncbi:hypothetical protein [uncultured Tenacibaculum sp.]|uniref:hypothetical protein n=1 Tax=uncultured Tenacibaculum sp. TaxID=174713 RepID=UPI00261539E8|nr:hypothetical protein [uncultured Tenacibaculum sp.]
MKRIFKRIKVNKELLKLSSKPVMGMDFSQYLLGETNDTIPSGKVKGVYFISYISENQISSSSPVLSGGMVVSRFSPNTLISHTDITLKDSRGHLLTEPTDLKDYEHKSGGYGLGFKELDFESKNEKVTITWETLGSIPILGEFVFVIETDNCAC